MNHESAAYGLWPLVLLNSAIFIIFAFSFYKPKSHRDWRSFGMYAAFIVVLFTEMFGLLLQWPTLVTVVMFPVLAVVYARLARREETDAVAQFGRDYEDYRRQTPAFVPRPGKPNWEKIT